MTENEYNQRVEMIRAMSGTKSKTRAEKLSEAHERYVYNNHQKPFMKGFACGFIVCAVIMLLAWIAKGPQ